MNNQDAQSDTQMAASGQRREDLKPEPFNAQKHADRQPVQPDKVPTELYIEDKELFNPVSAINPILDWREMFDEKFPLISWTNIPQHTVDVIISFIAEVEKLAEERGYDKAIEYKKHFASFDELKQGLKHTDEIRSSLKAELIEAGEKMKTHSFIERSVNEIISDYQDIIKSA